MNKTEVLFLSVTLMASIAIAGGKRNTAAGTLTTLNGFYDYQSNGGGLKYIAVNPANQSIHVVYMADPDSPAVSGNPARGTYYAFSTNQGITWNDFSNLRIPSRRSGFPSLDLLRLSGGYCTVIANHSIVAGNGNTWSVFIDCPEGGGAFAELGPPSPLEDALLWPRIACTSDSAIIIVAAGTVSGANGTYVRRLNGVAWIRLISENTGGRYSVAASATNRVSVLIMENGILLFESTDIGRTWPTTPLTIYPPQRIVGADTFQASVGCEIAYFGDTPVATIHEFMTSANATTDSSRILFWSQSTGLVVAADKYHTTGIVPRLNRAQANHLTMGYPAMGVAGPRIAIAYQAFMSETSAAGFNYSDIFYTQSVNGGTSWLPPANLTETSHLDERYPSISRWNEPTAPYFTYLVWQEDTQPGSAVFTDLAPLSRARQKFLRLPLLVTSSEERTTLPSQIGLEQNYPNPFNPSTRIGYSVPGTGFVSLKVFDVLGREVATLVDGRQESGEHSVEWKPGGLSSGVYFYRLTTPGGTLTRKLFLMR